MVEEKREVERLGGEFMIQDRDHTSGSGQMGGDARHGRQSEQSQGGRGQPGSGQQGGEQRRKGGEPKKGKLL